MKFVCSNCHEIIEESICPHCGYITEMQKSKELIQNAKMAVRYGYSYRKLAQLNNKEDKDAAFQYCIPEANEYLLWLGGAILSGIAWDGIKAIAAKIYSLIKTNKDIDQETEFVFSKEELYKFYTYIKDYENGLNDIDEFEYKYIEEEMMADFCAEMETEIYMKEKRKITIEERIQIYNIARLKIKSIVKR